MSSGAGYPGTHLEKKTCPRDHQFSRDATVNVYVHASRVCCCCNGGIGSNVLHVVVAVPYFLYASDAAFRGELDRAEEEAGGGGAVCP